MNVRDTGSSLSAWIFPLALSLIFFSLLLTMQAIQNFFCPNCLHMRHQCFVCGKLGNSDKQSGPEVWPSDKLLCDLIIYILYRL